MALSRSRASTPPARYSTLAFSAAKFTLASVTPSFLESARSTRRTQEAQVIPVTGTVICATRSFSLVVSMLDSPPSRSFESALCYTPLPYTVKVVECPPVRGGKPASRTLGANGGVELNETLSQPSLRSKDSDDDMACESSLDVVSIVQHQPDCVSVLYLPRMVRSRRQVFRVAYHPGTPCHTRFSSGA